MVERAFRPALAGAPIEIQLPYVRHICWVPPLKGLGLYTAPYPGLTPWANFVSPFGLSSMLRTAHLPLPCESALDALREGTRNSTHVS